MTGEGPARRRPDADGWLLARLLWEASGWRAPAWLVLTVVSGLAPLALNVTSSRLVGEIPTAAARGWNSVALREVAWAGLVFLIALAVARMVGAAGGWLTWRCNADYLTAIRQHRLASALLPVGVGQLEGGRAAGLLAGLDEIERSGLHSFALPSFGQSWTAKISGLAAAGVLFGLHWWAPVVLFLGWSAVNHAFRIWASRLQLGFGEMAGTSVRRANYFRELALSTAAGKELRIFGLQDWVVTTFDRLWTIAMRETWRRRRLNSIVVLGGVSALVAAHAAVLAGLAVAIGHGLGAYHISLFGQAILGMSGLGPIGGVQMAAARARVHARQLDDLRRAVTSEPRPRPSARTLPGPLKPDRVLALHDISFTYPGQPAPVLRNVSLTVPVGQRIALVGRNGAGKSTLINLLCRLYEPDSGDISYDGILQESTDPADWRKLLAVVPQAMVRLQASLYDNIAYAYPTLRDNPELVYAAFAEAGGEAILAQLRNGWDTWLDPTYPDGVQLSGGQWQRVVLARALLALKGGARLLILDEPAANLDVRSEAEIFGRVLALSAGITTVLVSHRLSTVRFADRIVVIDGGRIIEDGSHEQLMDQPGLYSHLYRLQAERFLEPEDHR